MKQDRQKTDAAEYVKAYRQKSLAVLEQIPEASIATLIDTLRAARKARCTVFICGNGGSAATA